MRSGSGVQAGSFVDVRNTPSLVFTEVGSHGRGDILKLTFLKGVLPAVLCGEPAGAGTVVQAEDAGV